jgi:malate synthase
MWAEPDDMRSMIQLKGSQLEAGASTAWVPSPTAATLHALHYLRTDVATVQAGLKTSFAAQHALTADKMLTLLHPPVMDASEIAQLSSREVQAELDDLVQGLLGYVVRWVGQVGGRIRGSNRCFQRRPGPRPHLTRTYSRALARQGIGCSKVPSMAGVQLMEDRATLRISSQLIANWRLHGFVSEQQLMGTLKRVAVLVDEQNSHEAHYKRLAPEFDGPEWSAALELISHGVHAPNGYTEPTLTKWRRERKVLDEQATSATATVAGELHVLMDAMPSADRAVLGDSTAYAAWARSAGATQPDELPIPQFASNVVDAPMGDSAGVKQPSAADRAVLGDVNAYTAWTSNMTKPADSMSGAP